MPKIVIQAIQTVLGHEKSDCKMYYPLIARMEKWSDTEKEWEWDLKEACTKIMQNCLCLSPTLSFPTA